MSLNKCMLIGNLGADPETRTVGATTVCSIRLATSAKYKTRDGEQKEDTQWHNVEAWGRVGELIQQYCRKGSRVYVEGDIRYRAYEKDGVKRTATTIRAATVQFLDSMPSTAKGGRPITGVRESAGFSAGDGRDEDVPF
jgi:single-strand DNA-binding protein